MREQEAKEEEELKAGDLDADTATAVVEKDVALVTKESDLFIRPYGRLPFHLLKRGTKPNAMYRFEKDQRTKDEFGMSVE